MCIWPRAQNAAHPVLIDGAPDGKTIPRTPENHREHEFSDTHHEFHASQRRVTARTPKEFKQVVHASPEYPCMRKPASMGFELESRSQRRRS